MPRALCAMAGEVDPLRALEQLAALEISSRSTFAKSVRAGADEVHGGKGGEGDGGCDGDGNRAEPERLLKDSEASEIEELIEELNSAIDGVNTLEDDHQRGKDERLAAQAAMRCQINVLTGELRPHEQALISAVEACNSIKRAVQQVAVAEEAQAGIQAADAATRAESVRPTSDAAASAA